MTQLLRFTVTGLAGRRTPIDCKLRPDVNIFFGLNGSGKTSLLKLLFSALQDDVALIRRVPFEEASVTFLAPTHSVPVTRSITSARLALLPATGMTFTVNTPSGPMLVPTGSNQPGWDSSESAGPQPPQSSYLSTFRLFGDLPGYQFGLYGEPSPYSETRLDQLFYQLVMTRWANYSNALLTQIRELQEQGIAAILDSLFSAEPTSGRVSQAAAEAYESVKHFLNRRGISLSLSKEDFLERYRQDPRLQGAVRDITEIEMQILAAESPRRALEQLVERFISTNKTISFTEGSIRVRAGESDIGIDLLSSGEKQLLRILIESLVAPGNCLLIDEPELSLHVDWQKELVRAIRTVNPSIQLVAATHSPEIMADVPDDQIIEL